MLSAVKKYRHDADERKRYGAIYDKYKEFTMVTREDSIKFLSLLEPFTKIKGIVVECGVWRGGMSAAMVDIMGKDRSYFLFDSFEGLPPAKDIDGESAITWQKDVNSPGYYDNCKAEMTWAEKAMKKAGVANYNLVKGWFDKTVPGYQFDEPIAVLRLDGDWYDSTMVCLENFFPKVATGGLIIIDDYYVWDGCAKATHDYLSKNKRAKRIVQAYSSGCYLIKK